MVGRRFFAKSDAADKPDTCGPLGVWSGPDRHLPTSQAGATGAPFGLWPGASEKHLEGLFDGKLPATCCR